jgi:hypothetical protein
MHRYLSAASAALALLTLDGQVLAASPNAPQTPEKTVPQGSGQADATLLARTPSSKGGLGCKAYCLHALILAPHLLCRDQQKMDWTPLAL